MPGMTNALSVEKNILICIQTMVTRIFAQTAVQRWTGGDVGMNLADFRKDRNGVPYKCKYHCDYGDGEFCHNKENGCVLNKSQDEEIKGRRMTDVESMGMLFDDPLDLP